MLFIKKMWSGKRGSNSRPQPWQGCALPAELFPQSTVLTVFVVSIIHKLSATSTTTQLQPIFLYAYIS